MPIILILEDNEERIADFSRAVEKLGNGFEARIFRDVSGFAQEWEACAATVGLISLDHDLNPIPGAKRDPGTGLDAAVMLGDCLPACPVLVHSTNTDRVYSMLNELRFSGWIVDRVAPLSGPWIETVWLPRVRQMLAQYPNTWRAELSADHASRVERMQLSLDGLSLGDCLGEMFASRPVAAFNRLKQNDLVAGPWFCTDDTEMAISLVAVLKAHGHVNQDALAKRFARRWERAPDRGYGSMTRMQLREQVAGKPWRDTAAGAFGGKGSLGNGGAMRVPPLGGYFADDPERAAREAEASAVVTHTHPEGVAGTIATAVAAAMAFQLRGLDDVESHQCYYEGVLRLTPESEVRRKIQLAREIPAGVTSAVAAQMLGNGSQVSAADTVPFCVWVSAHYRNNFVDALAQAISVGGDCDTNAAIVGGIVALSAGREQIPTEWLAQREPLRF